MDLIANWSAETFGIPERLGAKNIFVNDVWQSAIDELKQISKLKTPYQKLAQIGKAMEVIQQSMVLYVSQDSTAEEVSHLLPYFIAKAKISGLLNEITYVTSFHYTLSEGDPIELFVANFNAAVEHLKNLQPQTIKSDGEKVQIEDLSASVKKINLVKDNQLQMKNEYLTELFD